MRESHNPNSDKLVVKAVLEGKNKEMFESLMDLYNLKYNIEVFHFILKKVYIIEFGKEHNI